MTLILIIVNEIVTLKMNDEDMNSYSDMRES